MEFRPHNKLTGQKGRLVADRGLLFLNGAAMRSLAGLFLAFLADMGVPRNERQRGDGPGHFGASTQLTALKEITSGKGNGAHV